MVEEIVQKYSEELTKLGIEHEVLQHPNLSKVEDVVGFLHINIGDSSHTLILKADDQFIAVILRSDSRFDFEKFKKQFGVSHLRMATKEEFEVVAKVPAGAAQVYTPHASKTYIDARVFEKEYVYGGSGSFTETIKYKASDLRKIPHSIVENITASAGKKRVYSGVRATGRLHLGNYLGAIKGMLALQDEYECTFSVVDLHAMTTPYDAKTLKDSIRNVILDFLGAGLDPKKCHLEIQSQVPQHTELSFLLATIYPLAPLEDLPTFKEKKAQFPKHVTTALLYYPILMAADVLLYKGELVPVGIDQEPHLEVMRECARKFNSLYGETFPEPYRFKTAGEYVPSLTGMGKMSKTVEGSFINLADDLETIKKKLAKVPTDSGTTGGALPKTGGVASLFEFLRLFNQEDMYNKFVQEYRNGKIQYGSLKNHLAEVIATDLQPIQEKRKYYEGQPRLVDEILEKSNRECREIAQQTINEVKTKMGLPI